MIQKICHIILCAMLIASCGNRQKATTASQEVVLQESIDTVATKNTSVLIGTFWEAIRYKHYDGEKTTEYNGSDSSPLHVLTVLKKNFVSIKQKI